MPITVINSDNETSRFDARRLSDSLKRSLEPGIAVDLAKSLAAAIEAVGGAGVVSVSTDSIRYGVGEVVLNPCMPDMRRIAQDIVRRNPQPQPRPTPAPVAVAPAPAALDSSFGRAFMAGVLNGMWRYVCGAQVDEYFANLVRRIAKESRVPEQMHQLMTRISQSYETMSEQERAALTGAYAELDVQAPALLESIPPWQDIFGYRKRADKGVAIFGQRVEPRTACCQEFQLILDWIKVVKTTSSIVHTKDDVAVSAVSEGSVMAPNPSSFRWPLNPDGSAGEFEMDDGEETSPGRVLAKVSCGRDCQIRLNTTITLWEVDFNKIDKSVRQAIDELTQKLSVAAGLSGAPPGTGNLVRDIIDAILDKLGLRDDVMDEATITVAGGLGPRPLAPDTVDIKDLQVVQSGFQWNRVDAHTMTLQKTVFHDGGQWQYRLKGVIVG
jgi:hypothetical protein